MVDVRCVKCGRLLMKVEGLFTVEIKCPKCGYLYTYGINPVTVEVDGKVHELSEVSIKHIE